MMVPVFKVKLRSSVLLAAVPAVVLLKEENVLAAALRAGDAVGPATRDQVLTAVYRIGEVDDGFLEVFGSRAASMDQYYGRTLIL
jgi:hypothetical protein